MSELTADELSLSYDDRVVVDGLSLAIPDRHITVIVGANASGKSTLLRGLARLLKPTRGAVYLDGRDVHRMPTRHVARTVGLLPQSPIAPDALTVADLVARGRHPHQRWYSQWSMVDEAAVTTALEVTGCTDLAHRPVDELSGGQRQRVWIAMALAQETPILLLDEPTIYLDLAHQIEVLDLLADLNAEHGRTLVMVLHDLNLACRYAHHLIALRDGAIVGEGPPSDVVTAELVLQVFGLRAHVVSDPLTATPLVLALPTRRRGVTTAAVLDPIASSVPVT